MKNIFLIALTTLVVSCGTQKIVSYEYLAGTRGYNLSIKVDKNNIEVVSDDKRSENGPEVRISETSPELWKALQNGSKEIKLNKISELESPTQKRKTDAAMFAKLNLATIDTNYRSAGFDHGQPPSMLKTVVDSLVGLNVKNN